MGFCKYINTQIQKTLILRRFNMTKFDECFYDSYYLSSDSENKFRHNIMFSKSASQSVCFSGYREEKFKFKFNLSDSNYAKLENTLREIIRDVIAKGFKTFYCGMCYGFDIIAGEIILEQKALGNNIDLIAAIPFEEQAKSFTKLWRERYYNLLEASDKVITLQPRYKKGCYQRRNEYMANRCSLLICYYSGDNGGTKNMVDYCKLKNLEIINLKDILD